MKAADAGHTQQPPPPPIERPQSPDIPIERALAADLAELLLLLVRTPGSNLERAFNEGIARQRAAQLLDRLNRAIRHAQP